VSIQKKQLFEIKSSYYGLLSLVWMKGLKAHVTFAKNIPQHKQSQVSLVIKALKNIMVIEMQTIIICF